LAGVGRGGVAAGAVGGVEQRAGGAPVEVGVQAVEGGGGGGDGDPAGSAAFAGDDEDPVPGVGGEVADVGAEGLRHP